VTSGADRRREVIVAGHEGDEPAARAGLADGEPSVRAGALGALARIGALDDPTLAAALTDSSSVVRRRAAVLAATRPGVSLLDALDDPAPDVVEAAAFACGEREEAGPDVVDHLSRLATGHADALVREAAVAALGAVGDPAGLPAVLAATSDKPAIRRRAVVALAPFEGPEVDAAIADARTDRDWQVRQVAEELFDDQAE
jgi:HEAT repeat protein